MAILQVRKIGEALNGDVYDVVFEAQVFVRKDLPQPNTLVTFYVQPVGGVRYTDTDTTDGQGIASVSRQLQPGTYTVSAVLPDGTRSSIPQFSLKAPSRVPAKIAPDVIERRPHRVRVCSYMVLDERGNGLPNVSLSCTIPVVFGGARTQRVTTDATGRVEFEVTIPRWQNELQFVLRHTATGVQYEECLFA